jgi:hypothetical protein
MESEQERLQKLYGEMGDGHLLDLAEDMDSLRDEARVALTQELQKRGIMPQPPQSAPVMPEIEPELETGFGAGMPGIFPGGASMMEQALEPAEAENAKDGMSRLISFYDGMQLSTACDLLEDAEMEPVIEPIAGDALSGVSPRFEIWLETGEIERAKALLRAKMGLFPAAEVDEDDDERDDVDEAQGELVVADFESMPEAEAARAILIAAGIAATVDADESSEAVSVVVPAADQERALEVLAEKMGLQ